MKLIILSKGQTTKIDDEDFEKLSKHSWYLNNHGYVVSGCKKRILMHREVVVAKPFPENEVDHINGDRLDNRKLNLRVCTRNENAKNRRAYKCNTSGFKGVFYEKDTINHWGAKIRVNTKLINLGFFESKEEAAVIYDKAAIKYFGEFATLNIN